MSVAEYLTGAFFPAPIFTKLGPMPRQRHDLSVGILTPRRSATSNSFNSACVFNVFFSKYVAVRVKRKAPQDSAGLREILKGFAADELLITPGQRQTNRSQ